MSITLLKIGDESLLFFHTVFKYNQQPLASQRNGSRMYVAVHAN